MAQTALDQIADKLDAALRREALLKSALMAAQVREARYVAALTKYASGDYPHAALEALEPDDTDMDATPDFQDR